MDRNLSDDMVKLVRYNIVSIKRDAEKIMHRDEVIFDENMTDDGFATWVISKYGDARGLSSDDRKYLRVSYEVLDRWAKQDRKYEKRQLEVLEGIRDAIDQKHHGKMGRFRGVAARHEKQVDRLKQLRADFERCASGLAGDVADMFNKYREEGEKGWEAVELDAAKVEEAFKAGLSRPFSSKGLETFPGRWKGDNRRYHFASGEEMESSTWFMTWEPGAESGDEYVQRVIGSQTQHYDSETMPREGEGQVDLALNVYRKDIGITGWLSTEIEARQELALIAYQFGDDTFLWIGQVLDPDLNPVMAGNVFWMFLEWIVPKGKKPAYYMYGLMFEIDFDGCGATPFGDSFRKARFDRVT